MYLFKPLWHWSGWNIRVNDENIGHVQRDKDGNWQYRSTSMTLEDFDAFVWVIEQYEATKIPRINKVFFTAYYGDEQVKVELGQTSGGGEGYQILIGGYYHGMLVKRNNEWKGLLNRRSDLTSADILILGDIIDKSQKKP